MQKNDFGEIDALTLKVIPCMMKEHEKVCPMDEEKQRNRHQIR